jgi:EAL domain-containing protein (putative c-di-GMP-specific phosphodiesterase class I)
MAAFTLLRRLRPDYLKIAGHIVRGMIRDPVPRALATALNEVGHALGLGTIAAHVEHRRTLGRLRHIGVDYAQGFAIAPPSPIADLLLGIG